MMQKGNCRYGSSPFVVLIENKLTKNKILFVALC